MPKTSAEVIEILSQDFPEDKVKSRKGAWDAEKRAYVTYKYISSEDITERLNEAFGLAWSLRIAGPNGSVENFISTDAKQERHVLVAATIEYSDPDSGQRYERTGFGSKKITTELGNDFKAALSKAMSNASKKLGIGVNVGDDDVESHEATGTEDKPKTTGLKIGGVAPKETVLDTTPEVVITKEDPAVADAPKKGLAIKGDTVKVGLKPKADKVAVKSESNPVTSKVAVKAQSELAVAGSDAAMQCEVCTNEIVASESNDGVIMEPKDIAMLSQTFFNKKMCSRCIKDAKKQAGK
jgi:hypothetical protein